jgi:hypothetical protein
LIRPQEASKALVEPFEFEASTPEANGPRKAERQGANGLVSLSSFPGPAACRPIRNSSHKS